MADYVHFHDLQCTHILHRNTVMSSATMEAQHYVGIFYFMHLIKSGL